MRLILRILAAPLFVALLIIVAVSAFVVSIAGSLLRIASGIAFLLVIMAFLIYTKEFSCVLLVIAILTSPIGLPKLAEWLVDKVAGMCGALSGFVFGSV